MAVETWLAPTQSAHASSSAPLALSRRTEAASPRITNVCKKECVREQSMLRHGAVGGEVIAPWELSGTISGMTHRSA